jgi:hypothetical protein
MEALLNQYEPEAVVPLVVTHLAPLYATGQLSVAVERVCDAFECHEAAFKTKVGRYLECFCETLLG